VKPSKRFERKKVLLIDEEPETAEAVRSLLDRSCDVMHVGSSFRGIGEILSSQYDLLLIRWTRKQLSKDSILDYVDRAIQVRENRRGGSNVVKISPVVFLRKSNAAKYEVNISHKVPVRGCVSLDSHRLATELKQYC
jgi:CheY-like chemotaxis protein